MLHNKPVFKQLRHVQLDSNYADFMFDVEVAEPDSNEVIKTLVHIGNELTEEQFNDFMAAKLALPAQICYYIDGHNYYILLDTYVAPIVLLYNADGVCFLYSHVMVLLYMRQTIGHVAGLTTRDVCSLVAKDGVINTLTELAGLISKRTEMCVYDTYQFYP